MTEAEGGSDLVNYLVTPNQVSWQLGRQDSINLIGLGQFLNNDSLMFGGDYAGYDYSVINSELYADWGNDYIWLPSITEIGYDDTNDGMWELNIDERSNYDGINTSVSDSISPGFNNTSSTATYAYSWSRSAYDFNSSYVYIVHPTGVSNRAYNVHNVRAVRPALHLNLTEASNNMIKIAPNVTVGELWDYETNSINESNASILAKYLSGDSNISLSTIDNMATVGTTAQNLSEIVLASGVQNGINYSKKDAGDSIVVTLGGLKWYVTYLSKDINDDIIATLWLTNSSQPAFLDESPPDSVYYNYIGGGLYSDWSANWYDGGANNNEYPSNMYGTSYIRAVTLNNGGRYLVGTSNGTNSSTLANSYSKSINSVFADFTMSEAEGGSGLTEYIVKPNQVSWQLDTQDSVGILGYSYYMNNESINNGSNYSIGTNSYDYSNIQNYNSWGEDYLWLPSYTEIGYIGDNAGYWGTSVAQRANYDGNTSTVVDTDTTTSYWTRTAHYNGSRYVCGIVSTGASSATSYPNVSQGVRPALHLNLSKILYESMPFTQFTGTDSLGQPVTYNVSTSPYSTDIIINSVEMLGTEPASLVIPDTYVYNGTTYYVRSIYSASQANYGAFYLSKDLLLGVTLPSSILSVGDYAFNDCSNLSTVIFYNEFSDVNDIGRYAFYGNSNNVRYWFNTQTCLDIALSAYTLDNTKFTNNRLDLLSNAVVINVTNGSGTGLYAVGDNVTVSAYPYNDTRIVFGEWIDQNGNPLSTSAVWSFTASTSMDIYVEYKFVFGSYDITHISQLFWIAERVSEGIDFAGTTFNLTTDLYLTTVLDQVWQTIGDSTHNFAGIFNGNGYTIYYTASDNATLNGGTALHGSDVVIFNPSNTGTVLNLGTSGDVSLGMTDAGNQDWLYPTTDETDDVWQDDLLSKPR